ncbi:MAG: DNA translocase FtsK 4TM domain-containing protein, partial [Oscillospiraceae bacterium]|nr:DNA translocase FtsK 4TM domain-containing protein [Oscillospiraceae bacterium]
MAEKKKTKKTTKSSSKSDPKPRKKSIPDDAPPPPTPAPPRHREIFGGVLLCLAVFTIIGWFNKDGKFIAFFAKLFEGLLGWGSWLIVPVFLFAAGVLIFHRGRPVKLRVTMAMLLLPLFGALVQLFKMDSLAALKGVEFKVLVDVLFQSGTEMRSGGVLGGLLAEGLDLALSVYGAVPLVLVAFILALILAIRGTLVGLFSGMREAAETRREARAAYAAQQREQRLEEEPDPEPIPAPVVPAVREKPVRRPRQSGFAMDLPLGDEEEELSLKGPTMTIDPEEPDFPRLGAKKAKVRRKTAAPAQEVKVESFVFQEEDALPGEETEPPIPLEPIAPVTPAAPAKPAKKLPVVAATEIADPPKGKKVSREEVAQQAQAMADEIAQTGDAAPYEFPPLDLLRSNANTTVDARDEIQMNKERLEGALHSFGINAAIVCVTHGPTVTRYDIELEQGVKLARVTNLAGDLALALGVVNVRIAPIPDKISTVGIEVPNRIVSTVYLRDILASAKFQNAKSKISFALGKDIAGDCIVGNIAKLPHMLIAGTTGSGKSVCMNSLILSLLYKARPDEVRLIMIDPKMVELGVYNGIPHLYVPVVTDPKKAAGALQWSVVEMLKRYRLFAEIGVRDLESYNRHAQATGGQTLPQ